MLFRTILMRVPELAVFVATPDMTAITCFGAVRQPGPECQNSETALPWIFEGAQWKPSWAKLEAERRARCLSSRYRRELAVTPVACTPVRPFAHIGDWLPRQGQSGVMLVPPTKIVSTPIAVGAPLLVAT